MSDKVNYEAVIGLEVHAQMRTESKIFCGCRTAFGSEPNTQTCPVCLGLPGVLPVMNERALEYTVRTGLAMGCKISPYSRFARKNYFYPDLPKGYQVSQYEQPICEHGRVEINVDGERKTVGITRIHMEEDAGKNIHSGPGGKYSFVDLNRTGVPLMEIVSEPDMRTPAEASAYMKKIRTILRYLGVSDGNMEEGSLRCDANVSVRERGRTELGVKVEIKNINSFRFVERALEYEIRRQTGLIKDGRGGEIVQETRLWDTGSDTTQPMRTKEEAHDYRYFPEPDLVPIEVDDGWVQEIKGGLPELPDARCARFVDDYGLSDADAGFLTSERPMSEWFEEAVKEGAKPKAAANWVMGELTRLLNGKNLSIEECPLKPFSLVELLNMIDEGTISLKIAKTVFEDMFNKAYKEVYPDRGITVKLEQPLKIKLRINPVKVIISAGEIVKEKGLTQISDEGELEKAVDEVLAASPAEVERFRGGEQKLMGFFVGQVMKATGGKANPKLVNELLRGKLEGR